MNNQKTMKIFGVFSIILCYFVFISFSIINLKLNYLISLFLYFGLPSIYFSIRKPLAIKKTLIYSLILGVPAVFIFDSIAHPSNVWFVPSNIGILVFNTFPVDQIFWGILYFYLIFIIYNNFINKRELLNIFTKQFKTLIYIIISGLVIFSFIFIFKKEWLIINNFYAYLTLGVMLPFSLLFIYQNRKNNLLYIFLIIILSAVLALCYEYSAIKTGQWFFPGHHYLGLINFFDIRFPIEELLFLIFSVPGALGFYNLFAKINNQNDITIIS